MASKPAGAERLRVEQCSLDVLAIGQSNACIPDDNHLKIIFIFLELC